MTASAWAEANGDSIKFISLLCEKRKKDFPSSTDAVRKSVSKRIDEEKATALASLSGDTFSPANRLDPQTVDDLVGPAGLHRVYKAAETELKQQAAVLLHGADDAFSFARQTGDFSHVQKLETRLLDLGQTDAALELKESRTLYQQAEPLLRSSPNEPLLARSQQAQSAIEALRTPQNSARVDKVMGAVLGDISREQAKFKHDPAGYVAGNPLLQDEGLTPEAKIKTSLELQQRIGAGMGVTPQVLTAPQAAELQQRYEGTADFGEKAKIGMALYQMYGRYAVTAATEAKMPAALISIAQVAPNFTSGEVAKFLVAAEATAKDLPPLTPDEKKNREAAAANSPFLRTLATMQRTMYVSPQQAQFAADMAKTLTNYSLMGGNLKDFESKFQIVNDSDMAIIAPRGTPFDEDVLESKKQELVGAMTFAGMALDGNDSATKRLPGSAVGHIAGALGAGASGFLTSASRPNERHFFIENYRSMYDNGMWMYDPQEKGYVLWDKASGRAAPDLDGSPVVMRAEHMTGPRPYAPQMVKLQRGLK